MIAENQTYLALDPGKHFGFAVWQPGMNNPAYGTWKFEWGTDGERFLGLQKKLYRQHQDWGGLKAIRMEFNPHVHMGERAVDLGYGWKHAAQMFAAAYKIPFNTVTTEGGWRIAFIGRQEKSIISAAGRAAKKQGVKFDTRDQLKLATIGRCQQLGWEPKSADEADALGLLDSWLLDLRIQAPWRANEVLIGASRALSIASEVES
jgi:hypothetical protein